MNELAKARDAPKAKGLAAAANEMGRAREVVDKAVEFIAEDGRVEVGAVEVGEL